MRTMVDKKFIKGFISLALPVAIQQLVTQVLYMIDGIMIGSLGEVSITTVTICNTFIWLSTTVISGALGGAVIVCSQEYGRNNKRGINNILSLMLFFNIVSSLVFFLILTFFSDNIIRLYTDLPEIIKPGLEFFEIAKYTLLFNAVYLTIITILSSLRDVKISLYISVVSCVVKILMNWLLIYGNFGIESMGIRGVAISTLIARFIEMIIAVIYLFKFEKKLKLKLRELDFTFNKSVIVRLFIVSMPTLFMEISNNLISSVQTMITGHISEFYVSANSIVHSTWMIPSVFFTGIATAASIMIGNKIGENDINGVRKYARYFVPTTLVIAVVSSLALQIILPIVSSYYNVSESTLDLARRMGYFASITVIFMAFKQIIVFGVIKSKGNTRKLLKIDIISNWLIAVPFGYLAAFKLSMPPEYLYLILRSGAIVFTVWGLYQIKTEKWLF